MELQMDNKLNKLFDKLESLKEKEADILEEIKNRLYDLEEASDEDEFEDDFEEDSEDEEDEEEFKR
jgi:hypothetical protein